MKTLTAMLIVTLSFFIVGGASGHKTKTVSPTWATMDQRASAEIKAGGVYSRGHGAASPKLKAIVTRMIYMRMGHGYHGKKMWCYANRESGLNPGALSPTNDHNVFQFNWSAHHNSLDFNKLDEPRVGYAIIAADRMFKGAGYSPWAGGSHSCPQGNEP